MFLEKLAISMSRADFEASFAQAQYKDNTATLAEAVAGGTVVYQCDFAEQKLACLSLSIDGEFTQDAYDDLTSVMKSLLYIQKSRGLMESSPEAKAMPWKELIESPLPDSGSAAERTIQIFAAGWSAAKSRAVLSFFWAWPGQLVLQYKEEKK